MLIPSQVGTGDVRRTRATYKTYQARGCLGWLSLSWFQLRLWSKLVSSSSSVGSLLEPLAPTTPPTHSKIMFLKNVGFINSNICPPQRTQKTPKSLPNNWKNIQIQHKQDFLYLSPTHMKAYWVPHQVKHLHWSWWDQKHTGMCTS